MIKIIIVPCSFQPGKEGVVKVLFAQSFPFKKGVAPLVRKICKELDISDRLPYAMLEIVDFEACEPCYADDLLEMYSSGAVHLGLGSSHFIKQDYQEKYPYLSRDTPITAYDSTGAQMALYRLLLQCKDVFLWGIPENQDEEFLTVWNTNIGGRLERMNAPHSSKARYWEEFCRVFTGTDSGPMARVIFEVLWKCQDLGKWGLNDMLYRLRHDPHYHPLEEHKFTA